MAQCRKCLLSKHEDQCSALQHPWKSWAGLSAHLQSQCLGDRERTPQGKMVCILAESASSGRALAPVNKEYPRNTQTPISDLYMDTHTWNTHTCTMHMYTCKSSKEVQLQLLFTPQSFGKQVIC